MTNPARKRSARLNLRVTQRQKRTYSLVAERQGVTVSDFILECADRRAEQLSAEKRDFVLPAARWREFVAALEEPAKARPRLRKLLSEPGVLGR